MKHELYDYTILALIDGGHGRYVENVHQQHVDDALLSSFGRPHVPGRPAFTKHAASAAPTLALGGDQ